jgi:CO/xanthine dehydrogenase Mo-binding subunit
VYTNNPPAGAMRGFGVNQVNFAMEGVLDLLAEKVGIDGWEIRWRNALAEGDTFPTGQVLGPGVGLKKTLQAVRDVYRSAKHAGIACGMKNSGVGNGLTEWGKAILRVEDDGSVTLFHSWTEMGQGVHTAMLQIACQELGLSPEKVRVSVDTIRDLDTGQCTASRSTVLGGRAVMEAARKLKAELDGKRLEELAGQEFYGEYKVDWTYKLGTGPPGGATHYAYGWATQVCTLDDDGRIEKVIAAHDVGKVINPTLLEGQIEGAIHMGLGHALSEELVLEEGVPATTTLKSLGIIPPIGMPEVECVFVEEHQPEGPYGAKGVGEIGLVPIASAVRTALYRYDGQFRTRLPMRDSSAARAAVPRLAAAARRGAEGSG